MQTSLRITQGVLFYIVWYVAITQVSRGSFGIATSLLGLFFLLVLYQAQYRRMGLVLLAMSCIVIEFLVNVCTQAVVYRHDEISLYGYPLWLTGMWGVFVGCMGGCLQFLTRVSLFKAVIIGAVGGSVSSYSAYTLGALVYPLGVFYGLAWTAVLWGGILPFIVVVVNRIGSRS
jgi:ABC-type Fe3+-siderophore transport system permease subunit